MSKWIGKKQVLLAVLVVSLGVAVYLNYYFASTGPLSADAGTGANTGVVGTSPTEKHLGDSQYVGAPTAEGDVRPAQTAGYFDTARQSRQDARDEALEIIQDTLQDVKITEDIQRETMAYMETITQAIERENAIESLIRAKGFPDCVAYIDGDNCHIVVQADELDAGQTLQILEIVLAQSSVPAEKVNILTVNS